MKKVFYILIFLIYIFTYDVFASEYNVFNEAELSNYLNDQSSDIIINLKNDIDISNMLYITGNVKINGNGYSLSFNSNYNDKLFLVNGSLELYNLKIDGGNKWNWINLKDKYDPNVYGNSSTLNIQDRIINYKVFDVTGKLIISNSSIFDFYIDGASDDKNVLIYASGDSSNVIIDSTVVDNLYGSFIHMNNGIVEINNNSQIINSYGLGNKGALFKQNGGKLVINNLIMKDNCGVGRSGSLIGAVSDAEVIFNDGLIDNNIAKYHGSNSTGSMITLESGAGFIMNGGVISNNIGTLASVISTRWTNAPSDKGIYLNKGIIKNNSATKTNWLEATVFIRSSLYIGKDMIIDGDVVVNNTDARLENNGTINGKVTLNDSTSKAVNNGYIKEVDLLKGEFINNNIISSAYELNTQIDNNGSVTGTYIKELSNVDGKVLVKYNINEGKDVNTGYTLIDKLYDKNYLFTKDDIFEVEKVGYTFEGWYIDEEFKEKFDSEIELVDNIILYAKWNKIEEVIVPDSSFNINKSILLIGLMLIMNGFSILYLAFSRVDF